MKLLPLTRGWKGFRWRIHVFLPTSVVKVGKTQLFHDKRDRHAGIFLAHLINPSKDILLFFECIRATTIIPPGFDTVLEESNGNLRGVHVTWRSSWFSGGLRGGKRWRQGLREGNVWRRDRDWKRHFSCYSEIIFVLWSIKTTPMICKKTNDIQLHCLTAFPSRSWLPVHHSFAAPLRCVAERVSFGSYSRKHKRGPQDTTESDTLTKGGHNHWINGTTSACSNQCSVFMTRETAVDRERVRGLWLWWVLCVWPSRTPRII